MKNLLLITTLAASMSVSAGELYLETGAGTNTNLFGGYDWDNGGGIGAYISLRYEFDNNRFFCQMTDISQWDVGPPFNDRGESAVVHIGCAVRWSIF